MTFDRLRQIVRLRLRSLVSGTALDRELDEELRDHIERQIESNLQAGMTPIEARRSALVGIGGVRQTAEQCRDQRGLRGIDSAVADTRYAVRVLKRSPVFASVAIASLALGIGAFLAMFQLVDAIRLRPLPVDDAHELVEIRIHGGRGGWGLSDTAAEITLPLWEQIRAHQTVLTDVFAWGRSGFLMGTGADAVPLRGLVFQRRVVSRAANVTGTWPLVVPRRRPAGLRRGGGAQPRLLAVAVRRRSRCDWHLDHVAAAAVPDRRSRVT